MSCRGQAWHTGRLGKQCHPPIASVARMPQGAMCLSGPHDLGEPVMWLLAQRPLGLAQPGSFRPSLGVAQPDVGGVRVGTGRLLSTDSGLCLASWGD